jgi:prepilin-type N-terminal cleavage/methylation domain-containing protein
MNKFFKRGFSLIELLVVLGIFVIITSVVLARQNRFSSDIILTDLAYQVAVSIRQAQVYGIGVRGSGAAYDIGYGVHFATPVPMTSYTFFPDLNKNQQASASELSAAGSSVYQIAKGKITDVCAYNTNTLQNTCLSVSGNGISAFDVVYIRPNPAANITDSNGNNSYSKLIITLSSALGDRYKCITAYSTGEVAVSNPTGTVPNPCI